VSAATRPVKTHVLPHIPAGTSGAAVDGHNPAAPLGVGGAVEGDLKSSLKEEDGDQKVMTWKRSKPKPLIVWERPQKKIRSDEKKSSPVYFSYVQMAERSPT